MITGRDRRKKKKQTQDAEGKNSGPKSALWPARQELVQGGSTDSHVWMSRDWSPKETKRELDIWGKTGPREKKNKHSG